MNERRDEPDGPIPVPADRQDAPPPERPTTPQEDAGQDLAQLDDPPQAEGDRDDSSE